MHNNMKLLRSRLFLFLVCLGVALAITGAAVAAELPAGLEQKVVKITKKMYLFSGPAQKDSRFLDPEHEEIDHMVGLVTVKKAKRKKGQKRIDHSLYRFNGNTIVRGAKGQKVTMNELLTPCKAKIYFYPNARKAPILYSIEMTGRYKNSTRKWNTDHTKE
jgi:hypothetical protein